MNIYHYIDNTLSLYKSLSLYKYKTIISIELPDSYTDNRQMGTTPVRVVPAKTRLVQLVTINMN